MRGSGQDFARIFFGLGEYGADVFSCLVDVDEREVSGWRNEVGDCVGAVAVLAGAWTHGVLEILHEASWGEECAFNLGFGTLEMVSTFLLSSMREGTGAKIEDAGCCYRTFWVLER